MSHRFNWPPQEKQKMKEPALLVSTQESLARVKVKQKDFCDTCSARSLCVGQKQKDGTIVVFNPLSAKEGDLVTIEIPESRYTRELIIVFGVLLGASLLGLLIGYISSFLLLFHSLYTSFIGFFSGLVLGGFFLLYYFRHKKENKLYPVIVEIVKKEDAYEKPQI